MKLQRAFFAVIAVAFLVSLASTFSGGSNQKAQVVDATIPTAPTSLTFGTTTSYTIPFSWSGATDNAGIAGYEIYRNSGGNGGVNTTTPIATVSASTSYTDTGLLSSKSYKYRIKTVDTSGNKSSLSSTFTSPSTKAVSMPGTPTIGNITSSSLKLTWTAPASGTISNYAIYSNAGGSTSVNTTAPIATVPFGTNTYTVTGLSASTTYIYRISALDPANNRSTLTTSKSATTLAGTSTPPSTVSSLDLIDTSGTILTALASGLQINIGSQSNATYPPRGHNISVKANPGSVAPVSINFNLTGPAGFTAYSHCETSAPYSLYGDSGSVYTAWPTATQILGGYTLTVTPYDSTSCGGSAGSPLVSQFVLANFDDSTPPTNPSNVAISYRSATEIRLAWTGSTDASGINHYDVTRNPGSTANAGTNTSLTDTTGLSAGATYGYSVTAIDNVGNTSGVSNTATAPTLSTTFATGNNVVTTGNANVKTLPDSGSSAGTQVTGSTGTIIGGPVWIVGGTQYWNVNFASGTDGWVSEGSLTISVPPPTSDPVVNTTCPTSTTISANTGTNATVVLCAAINETTPSITLNWSPVTGRTVSSIVVYRKSGYTSTSWTSVATPSAGSTSWTDTSIAVGQYYEYKVVINGNSYGYIATGIKVPQETYRGRLVLVVDNTFQTSLATQIQNLIDDLNADKWIVSPIYVSRTATPASVRSSIQAIYNSDPTNTKAVFLLGHVPVATATSGGVNPDGHANRGMSSDPYYGEMTSTWNNVTGGCSTYTWNPQVATSQLDVPNSDARFCHDSPPSALELQVGRVDFYKVLAYGQSEDTMLSNYLTKAHNFKIRQTIPTERAYFRDRLDGCCSATLGRGTWASVPAVVGIQNTSYDTVVDPPLHTILNNQSYLFAFGTYYGKNTRGTDSGTTMTWTTGLGASTNPVYLGYAGSTWAAGVSNWGGVFNILFGSYFGEWNDENAYLKSLLATGNALTSVYGGKNYWYFHSMGMGKNIGFSQILAVNNTSGVYTPMGGDSSSDSPTGRNYMALLGDPTLRATYVGRPSNLVITNNAGNSSFSWTASTDSPIGYNIYEIQSGSIVKLNSAFITGTTYSSTDNYSASKKYMVTAVKVKSNNSGTYYNESLGAIAGGVAAPSEEQTINGINGPVGPSLTENQTVGTNPYAGRNFFVSCSGNDSNNGTSASTPWATIAKVNMLSKLAGDIIYFQRGCTFRGQIDVAQSGTSTKPIEFNAYGTGTAPVIAGTTLLSGWTQHSGNIWKTTIGTGLNAKYLFVDGAFQTLARQPNTGFYTISSKTATSITDSDNSWLSSQSANSLAGSDLVLRAEKWAYTRQVISSNSGSTITVPTIAYSTTYPSHNWGYFLQNKLSYLDQAGEWYYDSATGNVYFWPPGNVNPNTLSVDVATTPYGFLIASAKTDILIRNLNIERQTDHSIRIQSNKRVTIKNNNIGKSQIGIRQYTPDGGLASEGNTFKDNYIHDTTATGIEGNNGNGHIINGNVIENVASSVDRVIASTWTGFGINILGSVSNYTISRNILRDIGYIGIVASGNGPITENLIERPLKILVDGGGIAFDYTDGMTISKNIVKDVTGNIESLPNPLPSGMVPPAKGYYFGDHSIKNTTLNGNIAINVGDGIWIDHNITYSGNQVINNILYNVSTSGIGLTDYSNRRAFESSGGCGTYSNSQCFFASYNDVVTGNKVYGINATQPIVFAQQVYSNGTGAMANFGTVNNNYYYNPYNTSSLRREKTFAGGTVNNWDLTNWRSNTGYDAGSTFSNYTLTNPNLAAQIFYNATPQAFDQAVSGCNANGTPMASPQTIQPFTAIVVEHGNC